MIAYSNNMRQKFFADLEELMTENQDVYFITGDLGYFFADRIRDNFPDRFINVGAAECTLLGVGIGLALEGKIPFCYSITPFLLYRPFEAIRNYLHHEQIPVILVGSGRGKDYAHDGFSHDASDDGHFLHHIRIRKYFKDYPKLKSLIKIKSPAYINLSR